MTDITTEEFEICQNIEPHDEESSVKSQANVKFAVVEVPTKFARLQCNTDLKRPPLNWLSNSGCMYGLQQFIYHSPGFASFRMAHKFSECLGDMDVVSDAENIKTLLKLSYASKSAISMMVHRVGNTLLIDEFDIQRFLLRKRDDDWKWLRTFIIENILSRLNGKNNFCIKDKSRCALQDKNLMSKFLYHSFQQACDAKCKNENLLFNKPTCSEVFNNPTLPFIGPMLPDPNIEENVPDPNSKHVFNRNIVWNFEDIRMLIGTDMPIFGGGRRPCVSLRLRDMSKPINVLTGIDYWLDNLMCNVPEVVMCYHLDGIVQKYDIIKTEDLPYLENSQFSPQIVRNVAQNILAFLKANATKAGHTYWLFKGKNDDVVKLYDLTTLCQNEECHNKFENPFTVPVGMLLYSVARNMKNSSKNITNKVAGSINTLLENCIKLLPKEKYPRIVTSSHFIISDLHIPAGIDPKSPSFHNKDFDSMAETDYEDESINPEVNSSEKEGSFYENVAIKSISDTLKDFYLDENWKNNRSPPPLNALLEERCNLALQHIYEGLNCLKYIKTAENREVNDLGETDKEILRQKIIREEQNQNMAKPFQPIPLSYEMSKNGNIGSSERNLKNKKKGKNKNKEKFQNNVNPMSLNSKNNNELIQPNYLLKNSWDIHLKILLMEKCYLVNVTLAEHSYSIENYGSCIRFIYLALQCQEIVQKYSSLLQSKDCLYARAGDSFFQITKKFDDIDLYLNQFQKFSSLENKIVQELQKENISNPIINLPVPEKNIEKLMLASCELYKFALNASTAHEAKIGIIRRFGNVQNELGVKYMNWAQDEYGKFCEKKQKDEESHDQHLKKVEPQYQVLARKSYECLMCGIASFKEVNDKINLAFLLCNMGRFMRFRAHVNFMGESEQNLNLQKKFYNQAFTYYSRALLLLENRKHNTELWDLVNWELSTATFILATLIQDYSDMKEPPENVQQEILNLLQRSLKLCEAELSGSKKSHYLFRSGLIHHRLASFHRIRVQKVVEESKKKKNLQLCMLYYEKAAKILEQVREPKDYLIVQLERIALQEYLLECGMANQKSKKLIDALEIFFQCNSIISHIANNSTEMNTAENEILKLLKTKVKRLQQILRTLTQFYLCKSGGKDLCKPDNIYKKMYSITLKIRDTDELKEFAQNLSKILCDLIEINK